MYRLPFGPASNWHIIRTRLETRHTLAGPFLFYCTLPFLTANYIKSYAKLRYFWYSW